MHYNTVNSVLTVFNCNNAEISYDLKYDYIEF